MRLIAATALLALGLTAGTPALAETNVGVTAAVNQDAKAVVGSNIKTISLGDSVVFNQRIETGGSGLVQVLLADGTTFMVGPNSDLVIDSFVYDPNAGTAQVTASFTKGVLRFIGGQTSKTEGGVTINTPVGTMGIRGAMVDIVLDPPAGTPPHIDMLFGNEVTLEKGKELLGRLYAAGYSLALGDDGVFDVLKTPPGWGSQIQAALAGKPGTKGGAPKGPSDGDVKNSDVADNNSGNGVDKNTGNRPLSQAEIDALLEAAALYDELRDFILNNQTPQGFFGGVITGPDEFNTPVTQDFTEEYDDEAEAVIAFEPTYVELAFDMDGNPVRIKSSFFASPGDCSGSECDVSVYYEGDGITGRLVYQVADEEPLEIETSDDRLISHQDVGVNDPDLAAQLEAELNCESCDDFIRWGFWGFSATDIPYVSNDVDVDFAGTWVTGDLTTRAQLDNLAALSEENIDAYYSGDVVGNVHNGNTNENYVATGDLLMNWNFGGRTGHVGVSGFDISDDDYIGKSFGYDVSTPGQSTAFSGNLDDSSSTEGIYGSVQGAFVNNGTTAAGGVIGNFNYVEQPYESFPTYSASGIFIGDQSTY